MVPGAKTRICLIEHIDSKIVIMDAPNDNTSALYVKELKAYGVTDVVRTCEPTYAVEKFEKESIQVHDWAFPDGAAPPDDLLEKWTDLIQLRYRSKDPGQIGVVAVHCVAGLGRAPVMAAVALMELTGIDCWDVVEKIREKQKGAINARQLEFLRNYRPKKRRSPPCGCVLM
mmetsp:Transcript_44853/g.100788  ORF Transcript_44853/g.100788 Transcript_44853/m.100788 type:complete len:172 (+) Transcript_44853:110-625(+)